MKMRISVNRKFLASVIAVVAAALLVGLVIVCFRVAAQDYPFDSLFEQGFEGYTSDEGQVLTTDYVSSKAISVRSGETVWFGPCDIAQYFQLVGCAADGTAVTDKIRDTELEISDRFENGMVIYKYIVPEGVEKLIFSAPAEVSQVYAVAKTEISNINWRAYWNMKGVDVKDIVGASSYCDVKAGDKLYFGAVTEAMALASETYDEAGNRTGTIDGANLRLVESFGGEFGIYCYTVPGKDAPSFVRIAYDTNYQDYYTSIQKAAGDKTSDESIVESFLAAYGVPQPISATVEALSGKKALFVGDSITFGARDRANIYGSGGWAGRIGYYCGMDVDNNGVSGACISTARLLTSGEGHYIYNNLVKARDNTYDYVIMHGMFNDASEKVPIGTPQGKAAFRPDQADASTFAGALELLFYTARQQHPEAVLGYIVNFKTERNVDDEAYANMAIRICGDWGIPYLNLYRRTDIVIDFDDGLHPSSAGYDGMYSYVANWMAGLGNGNTEPVYNTGTTANIMSYNIFWDAQDKVSDGKYTIPNRVEKIQNLIKSENPDILLLQEVGARWASYITKFAKNNGYGYYGYSHIAENTMDQWESYDQYVPILWKTNLYDLKDSGHFWLSATPDQPPKDRSVDYWPDGSTTSYPRCVNWVVLENKTTKAQLLVMNVHTDPNDEHIRNLSAQLVAEKLSKLRGSHGNIAAVVGGDWNMNATCTAYHTITGNGFMEIRKCALDTVTGGAYNAWNRTSNYTLGDYLFMADGMGADIYRVVEELDSESGYHLSDHCPIKAKIGY